MHVFVAADPSHRTILVLAENVHTQPKILAFDGNFCLLPQRAHFFRITEGVAEIDQYFELISTFGVT